MDTRPIDIAKLPDRRMVGGNGYFADGRKLRRAVREPGGTRVIPGYSWKNERTAAPAGSWNETLPAGTAEEDCHADV